MSILFVFVLKKSYLCTMKFKFNPLIELVMKKGLCVSRETFLSMVKADDSYFENRFVAYRKTLNYYFKFKVNGKYVGFSGLFLAIMEFGKCSFDMALTMIRDMYYKIMPSKKSRIVFRFHGLKIQFDVK